MTPPHYYFDEMLIMEEAGLSPMEVIKASTSIAADCIDANRLGAIENGRKADLIIVDENPLENLEILKEDKLIIKHGTVVK